MIENVEESLVDRVCNMHMSTLSLSEIYKYGGNEFTLDNKEIDVILENKGTLHPIEIKSTSTPSIKACSSFNVLNKSNKKIGTSAIICASENISSLTENNIVIPYYLI